MKNDNWGKREGPEGKKKSPVAVELEQKRPKTPSIVYSRIENPWRKAAS